MTGQHIDMKYLHSFFADCYMFIPLKDREGVGAGALEREILLMSIEL